MDTPSAPSETAKRAPNELDKHPGALYAAIGLDGLFVAMPDSVGAQPEQVINARSALDIVAPEDRLAVIEAWERAKAHGSAHAEVHLAAPPGQPVTLYFADIRQRHGVFLAAVVAHTNTTGATVGLGTAPPSAPRVAAARKDSTATFIAADEATLRMFGWPASDLIGKRSLDFVHPDDQDKAIDNWMEMLTKPSLSPRVRIRYACADGSWKWVEMTNTSRLDDPDHNDVLAEILDVSDEMAALEALRAREQLLHRLAEALPTGVLQIDPDRKVVYANRRIDEILGVPASSTADERFEGVCPADRESFEAALSAALGAATDADLEVGIQSPTGLPRRCQIAIRPLTGVDAVVTGAVLCATDVTDSARMRADLERQATTDLLTGCRNRTWVMAEVGALVGTDNDLAVIFVDIDDFKSVNDHLGHAAGDTVLRTVAARLGAVVRASDTVGRVGGDEFLVVCPRAGGMSGARRLLQRVADTVGQSSPATDGVRLPGASVGLAYRGGRPLTADQLVAEADAHMYAAKRARQRSRRPRVASDTQG